MALDHDRCDPPLPAATRLKIASDDEKSGCLKKSPRWGALGEVVTHTKQQREDMVDEIVIEREWDPLSASGS